MRNLTPSIVNSAIIICMAAIVNARVTGPASSILVSSGSSQTAVAGTTMTVSLVAVEEDSSGRLISGAPVTWMVSEGNGSLSAASTTTDARGLASNTLTLGTLMGSNQVIATDSARSRCLAGKNGA